MIQHSIRKNLGNNHYKKQKEKSKHIIMLRIFLKKIENLIYYSFIFFHIFVIFKQVLQDIFEIFQEL